MDPFLAQLSEFLDGSLGTHEADEVRAHLLVCANCREVLSDLARLKTAAASLEQHRPPEHAWTRISAEIKNAPRALAWWRPLLPVAAVLLVGATAAVLTWHLPSMTRPVDPDAATPAPEWQVEEEKYQTTLAGLEKMVKADEAALDPGVARSLESSLRVIDQAIDESKRAARSEPDDALAQESLFDALHRKLTLLENTVLLLNDIRRGEVTEDSLRGIQSPSKSPDTKG